MLKADVPVRRQAAFATCGDIAFVQQAAADPEKFRISCNQCHDRFCVPCTNGQANSVAGSLAQRIASKPHRFLTLTLKTDHLPLAELLNKLWSSFKRLRNQAFWKSRVYGGCAFLEVKYNAEKQRWHPHLHCIIEGRFVPHTELKQAWNKATSDSYIVDIRLVRDPKSAARYVAKYVTKGWHISCFETEETGCEVLAALRNRRLATTFGSWRGFKLTPEKDGEEWSNVATLPELIAAAKRGDARSIWILAAVSGRVPETPIPPEREPPPQKPPPEEWQALLFDVHSRAFGISDW